MCRSEATRPGPLQDEQHDGADPEDLEGQRGRRRRHEARGGDRAGESLPSLKDDSRLILSKGTVWTLGITTYNMDTTQVGAGKRTHSTGDSTGGSKRSAISIRMI